MKNYLLIPIACILLLSGMHLTIAIHFCGGEIAAAKISFTGKLASCGMATDERLKTASEPGYTSNCCENESCEYLVDSNYVSSESQQKTIQRIISESVINYALYDKCINSLKCAKNVGPPVNFMSNEVSITNICVFRI